VLFVKRFLIDTGIKCGIEVEGDIMKPLTEEIDPHLRIFFFDIEVKAPIDVDFPTLVRHAPHEIIVISYWDSKDQLVRTLSLRDMKDEKELINTFFSEIRRIDPDIILGYNLERFDMPYLFRRAMKNKIPIGRMSPLGKARFNVYNGEYSVKGVTILDYAKMYREFIGRELAVTWFEALDLLAQRYLGIRKIEIDDFTKTWEEEPEEVERRCALDVAIMVEIEKKISLIPLFDSIRKEIGCLFDDIYFKSKLVDMAMLRYAKENNFVLPNKPVRRLGENEERSYAGAYVLEPTPGVYEDVLLMDFSGFYPRIILLYNISPETVKEGSDKRFGGKYSISSSDIGMLPSLVKKYLTLKLRVDKELKRAELEGNEALIDILSTRKEAIKRVLNSFYGAIAYSSRLSSPEAAEATTMAAKAELQTVINRVEKMGGEVLYADTDSCFIRVPQNMSAYALANSVKKRLPKGLEMDIKTIYERIAFITKKRYMGKVKGTGKLDRKGIQSVRSDAESYLTDVLDKLLQSILNKDSKDTIIDFLRASYSILKKKEVSPDKLARPIQLKKKISEYKVKSFHVKGIEYSRKHLKREFYPGTKVKILRIKKVPRGYPDTEWLVLKPKMPHPEGFIIDYEYYAKRMRKVLKPILALIGLHWEHVETRTLESFLTN